MIAGSARTTAWLCAIAGWVLRSCLGCILLVPPPAHAAALAASDLADLSLEQLGNIVVTSVARREQRLHAAAASIYVISAEDIRRSGVTSLPEALRLAPNLQVARAGANQYAISARGFNNVIANRLLVLIDGRIVYSPLFSGVFWEVQDVLLEDVERIEVISGPGATLWGANAVNGVINITTRPAYATQGPLASLGAGNRERGAAVRYGGTAGGGHFRVYAKGNAVRAAERANRVSALDSSERLQAGFRGDWRTADRALTVQGDAYRADVEQALGGSRDLAGANLLARYSEERADGSSLRVQAYYDRVERDHPGAIREALDIADVEFQHGLPAARTHHVLWGGGYRYSHDRIENVMPATLGFLPPTRDLHLYHLFVQDEWRIAPELALTVGVKAEHNSYSGLEWLPSARIAWSPTPERLVWSAISRTVRAPSRIDREIFLPAQPPFTIAGGPGFRSEVSNVAEAGYRAQASTQLSYSVTAFYHQHQRLRSLEPRPGGAMFENRISGSSKGVEAWASWRPVRAWRLDAGWVELRQRLGPEPGSLASVTASGLGNDPRRWLTLRSHLDLTPRHEFDISARYVGSLPNPPVPSYTAVDARLGWHLTRSFELSLLLQNVLDRSHPEWGPAATRVEFRRGAFLKAVWRP